MTPYQIWSAVHPDLRTKTLLVLGQGTVLLIRDYKKFFNDPTKSRSSSSRSSSRTCRNTTSSLSWGYRRGTVGFGLEQSEDVGDAWRRNN